jgi:hypothetical protein
MKVSIFAGKKFTLEKCGLVLETINPFTIAVGQS